MRLTIVFALALLALKASAPWLRRHLSPAIAAQVRRDLQILAYLQRFRHPTLTTLINISADFACSYELYYFTIPVLCWAGMQDQAFLLAIFIFFQAYVTSYIKDLLCAPRPLHCGASSAQIRRLKDSLKASDLEYNREYGFPSSHTALALAYALPMAGIVAPAVGYSHQNTVILYVLSILWAVWIAFGRMYSLMHSLTDVLGGAAVSLCFPAYLSLCPSILSCVRSTNQNVALQMAAVVLATIKGYPKPLVHTPSYIDTEAFIGAGWGLISGIAHGTVNIPRTRWDIHHCGQFVARMVVGALATLVAKEATVAVTRPLLSMLLGPLPSWLLAFLKTPVHDGRETENDGTETPSGQNPPASTDGTHRPDNASTHPGHQARSMEDRSKPRPRGAAMIAHRYSRMLGYAAVGYAVTRLAPDMFLLLQIVGH